LNFIKLEQKTRKNKRGVRLLIPIDKKFINFDSPLSFVI
jgi:hypothetical protein